MWGPAASPVAPALMHHTEGSCPLHDENGGAGYLAGEEERRGRGEGRGGGEGEGRRRGRRGGGEKEGRERDDM